MNLKALSTQMLAFDVLKSARDCPKVVVFGRPGAGKTTVANAAVEKFKTLDECKNAVCLGLDLDVCVPQWMKDNFANGNYPTLAQRQEFAKDCCKYVENELEENWQNGSVKHLSTIVSFSFVNTDLRDIFRSSFPDTKWVLVDTTEEAASQRMNARDDHFYKGDTTSKIASDSSNDEVEAENGSDKPDADNSDWQFAPVTFPHVILDGNRPIDDNAGKVLDVLLETAGIRQATKN
jgi:gluconate kinase